MGWFRFDRVATDVIHHPRLCDAIMGPMVAEVLLSPPLCDNRVLAVQAVHDYVLVFARGCGEARWPQRESSSAPPNIGPSIQMMVGGQGEFYVPHPHPSRPIVQR